jgi:NAD(P)-dependent dehydrogenase (short-subunit alcohol dehydrogenase family)
MNQNKKVALVTGASSGIGEATARLLSAAGYVVYGAARRLDRMQALGEAGIQLLSMDVSQDESMVAGITAIMEREGRLDVLVNNAGYGSYGALEDVPMTEARYQFEVNVFGLARLVQLVVPHMRQQGSGRIINVSSVGGRFGEPHGSWYHATKFAVEGLSDSLRMELKQFNIDVVVIQPGAIKTEWNQIARENLLHVSGDTAYGPLVHRHARMLATADQRGSEPEVTAQTIVRAAVAKHPKTRYAAGGGAGVLLLVRKLLTDRQFDALMLSQMK